MEETLRLHTADIAVLIGYLGLLTAIGLYHSRRPKDLEEYFLAGQSMRWFPIGISLMAALNSGMDYIMQPAGMIKFGVVCVVTTLSWLLLYPYVFFITLPLYRRLGGYSAYEYLENRFGVSVRVLTAAVFLMWRLGWMAAALYTPCLAIAVASGFQEYLNWIIIVLGAIVTFYTMLGGIRAVIWTDVTQFCIMFGGLAATLVVILLKVDGGLSAILGNVLEVGTDRYVTPDEMQDAGLAARFVEYFFIPLPVIGYLLATLVSRLATYTSDQVMVQRFQTSRSIRDARQGFIITALGDAIWLLALCFVGVALYTYFETAGQPPEVVRANPDQLFPYFLGKVFPAGLTGLVIAAILAASLSSIDSAINSMSTVVSVDFYGRLVRGRRADSRETAEMNPEDQRQQLRISRVVTVFVGIAGVCLACNVAKLGTLLEIGNKLVNGFTGPILGIFLLGMFSRRANQRGVLVGGVAGTLVSLYAILWSSPVLLSESLRMLISLFPEDVQHVEEGGRVLSFIWPSIFGLVTTTGIGFLFSLTSPGITDAARRWNWREVTRRDLVEEATT